MVDLGSLPCLIGGAMIINGKLHRGRHGLGGEFGYMTIIAPAEKLNNWSHFQSLGEPAVH